MHKNMANTAEFAWHAGPDGAVIDDVLGELECIEIPAELGGMRVVRAALKNKDLNRCRKLVVPQGLRELDVSFAEMEKLNDVQLSGDVRLIRGAEGINETEWFYRHVREPLYLDGWYCGYITRESGELKLRGDCRGVISLADIYNRWTRIQIPGNVKTIGMGAFGQSDELEELELGEGLERIGSYAFEGCPKLRRVYIPDSCREIGKFAFYKCDHMEEISMPEGCYRELGIGSPYPQCPRVILR